MNVPPQSPTGEVCVNCGSDKAVILTQTRQNYDRRCYICGDWKLRREAVNAQKSGESPQRR